MNTFDPKMDNFENRMVAVKALVGSHNYNMNTNSSDHDYKLFVSPSVEDLYYGKRFSASKTSPSVDYTVHDVRGLVELVWKANINFVEVLFSTDLYYHAGLAWLFNHREELASMNLPKLYECCMGMHEDKYKNLFKGTEKTKSLVKRFGYDTKQATHCLRMLYVVERVANGMSMQEALWFSNSSAEKEVLMSLKEGKLTLKFFVLLVNEWHWKKGARVREWFANTKADEALKEEAEEVVKNFVLLGFS